MNVNNYHEIPLLISYQKRERLELDVRLLLEIVAVVSSGVAL